MRGIKKTLLEGMITTNGAVNSDPVNQEINGNLQLNNLAIDGNVQLLDDGFVYSSNGGALGQVRAGIQTKGAAQEIDFICATVPRGTWGITGLSVDGILNAGGKLGYADGSGGSVTQATSKGTTVTLDTVCGQIIMNGATLPANSSVEFRVVNSLVTAVDVIIVNVGNSISGSTKYLAWIGGVNASSFDICVRNMTGADQTDAIVLNFAVIKADN